MEDLEIKIVEFLQTRMGTLHTAEQIREAVNFDISDPVRGAPYFVRTLSKLAKENKIDELKTASNELVWFVGR